MLKNKLNNSILKLWWKLPITRETRHVVKNTIFSTLPFIFKNTSLYYQWVTSRTNSKEEALEGSCIKKIRFDFSKEGFIDYKKNQPTNPDVKIIAFYLPQFHPFPENDKWWGKGFTEWYNVGKALPNYKDHYQPHCPIHNGYYDLRLPEVMEEQVRLAKNYGIHGFNYYFYWFDGKTLMEKPLTAMLKNKKINMPFCLTWANENWTRRWDGQENDVLIAQNHSTQDSLQLIRHLIKYFQDERYINIDNKPLLIIYRASIIPNMKRTSEIWREEVKKFGFNGLYLVCAQTFGIEGPNEFGFDAAMEFPPNSMRIPELKGELDFTNPKFSGFVYSYSQLVNNSSTRPEPTYKLFRTAMLSWDNTARKQNNSHIFHGFSLLKYKQWLSTLCNNTYHNPKYNSDEKLVFVNAWNEWAEGTHLEPDRKYGYGYLQSTYDVIENYNDIPKNGAAKSKNKKRFLATIVHVHYEDVWKDIKKHIDIMDQAGSNLYFTATSVSIMRTIAENYPSAYVRLVDNRGRDILPLIHLIAETDILHHDLICKIHSKKSVHRSDGDCIRRTIFNSLIGSTENVFAIISRFLSNKDIGLISPRGQLTPFEEKNMASNEKNVKSLCSELEIDFSETYFPAGSMFWCRADILEKLRIISSDRFHVEDGLCDGTLPHAIERIFCLLAESKGYSVLEAPE